MKRTWIVASVLALVAAACGGSQPAPSDGGDGGGAATSLTVVGKEFGFEPSEMTIAADTDVTVDFKNEGTIEHTWTVLEAGRKITSEDEFSEDLVAVELVVAPGSSASQTVNLPAGEYQVICKVPGHFSAGMVGTLVVGG